MDRAGLLRSLDRQRRLLSASIVLTPVDSYPFGLRDRERTSFLHGLYLTDKVRDLGQQRAAVVQFPRRQAAARDLDSIYALFAERLGADRGSLRMLSGLQAQASTFMSIASPGQTVALLSEAGGGHFSTEAILTRLGLRVLDLPLDYERRCVDRERSLELFRMERPDFVLVDRSEGLSFEDFGFIGRQEGPVKVFDASQYLPQILTGIYENPLDWGFDLMLFSLHKSFPGPQKAGIVARHAGPVWDQLMEGLSTFVSSSHAESTYLAGFALLEEHALAEYVERMLGLADQLHRTLAELDVPIVDRQIEGEPFRPATQHVWIALQDQETAFRHYESLAQVRIHANYRKLPYDMGYGLRLGTTFAASVGFRPEDGLELGRLVGSVLRDGPSASTRHAVRAMAEKAAPESLFGAP